MQDNKAQANAAVKEWICHNREEYERFKQQVAAIGEGDTTLPERMMTLVSGLSSVPFHQRVCASSARAMRSCEKWMAICVPSTHYHLI